MKLAAYMERIAKLGDSVVLIVVCCIWVPH